MGKNEPFTGTGTAKKWDVVWGFGFEGLTFLCWIPLGLERVFLLVDYVVI